jgi:hypothetical protein
MKKIFTVLLAISIFSVLIISCGEDKEQKIQELQKQVQIEKQNYEKEQKARDIAQQEAANSKSSLYLLIGISAVFVLIALFTGVALGSKARQAVNVKSNVERNENE